MLKTLLLLSTCLAVTVVARTSPNFKWVEEKFRSHQGQRYSNNILEDAILDVPGLVAKYGYPVEVHHVVTEDGYILEMHRIPHGRDNNTDPNKKRTVVYCQHGLFGASADFVVLGPENALAYYLAEAGYDVWLGNSRGNYYSRNHTKLNPDVGNDFWKFSWDEMGYYDLPACINFILTKTGQINLHYIGHSQGGAEIVVLNSLRPEYNKKFISFQGLAPACYFTYNKNILLKTLSPFESVIELVYRQTAKMLKTLLLLTTCLAVTVVARTSPNFKWVEEKFRSHQGQRYSSNILEDAILDVDTAWTIGLGEILGKPEFIDDFHSKFCTSISTSISAMKSLCNGGLNSSLFEIKLLNKIMYPTIIGHYPAGASIRQLTHYAQIIRLDSFQRYNHNYITNLSVYGGMRPPKYDLSKVTVSVYLYYGLSDSLAYYRDILKLADTLPNVRKVNKINRDSYGHFDFIFALDSKKLLYIDLVKYLKDAEDKLNIF